VPACAGPTAPVHEFDGTAAPPDRPGRRAAARACARLGKPPRGKDPLCHQSHATRGSAGHRGAATSPSPPARPILVHRGIFALAPPLTRRLHPETEPLLASHQPHWAFPIPLFHRRERKDRRKRRGRRGGRRRRARHHHGAPRGLEVVREQESEPPRPELPCRGREPPVFKKPEPRKRRRCVPLHRAARLPRAGHAYIAAPT
jgi:hypothetical protein